MEMSTGVPLLRTAQSLLTGRTISSMRHIYGKSFDNTRQHIFLKTDARKSRSQWSLNCICTDSVTPKMCSQTRFGIPRIYATDTNFPDLMAVVKVRDAP